MNSVSTFSSILLCLFLTTWAVAEDTDNAAPTEGTVLFGNGDRLSGHALAINDKGELLWNSSTLFAQVPLRTEQILEVLLDPEVSASPPSAHVAKVSLTNGDLIHGELTALDEEFVSLNTPYSGLLKIRRSMSSRIDISKSERTLYSGPLDLDNWTVADGLPEAWDLQNGALISRQGSSIARTFPLPEKSRLSFNVDWRSSLRLRLLLRSDDGETTQPDNCYDLVFNRRFVYLRKRWASPNGTGSRIVGQSANIQELNEKESARFDFYIDNDAGTIALYVDGKQAQVWTDEDPKAGSFGKWIHFIAEDGYPVRISRMEVSEWSAGKLPDDSQNSSVDPDTEGDGQKILLRNGDVLEGEVGEVVDGVLELKTEFTPVRVPINRMSTVNLTSKTDPNYEEPKRVKGDVRAWFPAGGHITFAVESLQDGVLIGSSQTFGTATFDLGSFSRVEFNIYNEDFRALRQESDW